MECHHPKLAIGVSEFGMDIAGYNLRVNLAGNNSQGQKSGYPCVSAMGTQGQRGDTAAWSRTRVLVLAVLSHHLLLSRESGLLLMLDTMQWGEIRCRGWPTRGAVVCLFA